MNNRHKEPVVNLISCTPWALENLLFTKGSRLGADLTMKDLIDKPIEWKLDHLDYMMKTIQTAFEFVDYTFEIANVSRAFTHQIVRTRTASFQQESLRAVDASNASCTMEIEDEGYEMAIEASFASYSELVEGGHQIQKARGALPINVQTKIITKMNLRTMSDMAKLRLCTRTQGEYQKVFKMMVALVLEIHPWAHPLLTVHCVRTGLCAFPNYDKCPVQKFTVNHIADKAKPRIQEAWEQTDHVANPVAKDGKSM